MATELKKKWEKKTILEYEWTEKNKIMAEFLFNPFTPKIKMLILRTIHIGNV